MNSGNGNDANVQTIPAIVRMVEINKEAYLMLRNVRRQRSHISPNFQNTHAVREQLLQEITEIQGKLDKLELTPSQNNLASVQSYKSMIHSRRQLLGDLSAQKDQSSRFGLDARMQ